MGLALPPGRVTLSGAFDAPRRGFFRRPASPVFGAPTYHVGMAHASDDIVAVAETFADVARTLAEGDRDPQSALEKIVHLAVESLDACEFAGIYLVEKSRITS